MALALRTQSAFTDCQPRSIISSAAAVGSGQAVSLPASNSAAFSVSSAFFVLRCCQTASAISGESTCDSAAMQAAFWPTFGADLGASASRVCAIRTPEGGEFLVRLFSKGSELGRGSFTFWGVTSRTVTVTSRDVT